MASNYEDHGRIDPTEHQPDPLKKRMFGSIANRIGTSASGLISSSLLKLDPLSVCSTVDFIGGDGNKAPPTSASSSDSASSLYIARTRGLAWDGTWPAPPMPQNHGNATHASHLEQWRHHHPQTKIASEFDDFVSASKRSQSQPWALTQTNQSGVEHIFDAGLKPGFAASTRDQSQEGVFTDESCRESKAIPSQLSTTECSFTSIRDRPGFGDFTPEWKRLHIQYFGDIQTAQYRQKLGHRTITDGARPGMRSPKNVVELPNMIDTRSHVPDDGAEVIFLLSDPEFCPGGESNDQFQYSIDEFSLEEESGSTGAMASTSSQSRATSEPDPLFSHLESKATPSGVVLALPSDEKMALNCNYLRFPARYVEEVWGFFTGTKRRSLASDTLPSGAVIKIPQLNGANEKEKPTALNRLAMVLQHLGPNTTKFGAQN